MVIKSVQPRSEPFPARFRRVALGLSGVILILLSPQALAQPVWIWTEPGAALAAPGGEVHFKKNFDLPEKTAVSSAQLLIGADNNARVLLNGREVGAFAGWNPLRLAAVDDFLSPGKNTLEVIASNDAGSPAGLIAQLTVRPTSGVGVTVLTSADWEVIGKDGASRPAAVIGRNGDAPWGMCLPPEAGAAELPAFSSSGQNLDALEQMLRTYHPASNIDAAGTYALAWLPRAMLWVADGSTPGQTPARLRTAARLSRMAVDAEGYVSCHQHEGLAHSLGWPFPLPTQSGGFGYYFTLDGLPYGPEFQIFPPANVDGWEMHHASTVTYVPGQAWEIRLEGSDASITSPPFDVAALVAPFIRVKWNPAGLPPGSRPVLEWTTGESPASATWHRMDFPSPSVASAGPFQDFDIPVHEITQGEGRITRLRIAFGNPEPGTISLLRVFSAVDSRHSINNANYLIAAADYLAWTGDRPWLAANLDKLRKAARWMIDEFALREKNVLHTRWIGHDGRSGIELTANGKVEHPGIGVGGNYWDLLPFGGDDVLGTIYAFHSLQRMAAIEELATTQNLSAPPEGLDAVSLRALAAKVRTTFQKLFWNKETQRFAPVDDTGAFRDYGFTFLNTEAIFYGLATEEQGRAILDWLSGRREVEGDTSVGPDIYRWRFGPRATTRRNIEYYAYVWSAPERIPFGDQVQDGGAVLGFTYHDLMARLAVLGPDDAWARLTEIFVWWDDVQAGGGARAYYAEPGRGKLQGGGTAGGLGIDEEFYESTMVTSVILDGFLGFVPEMDGFRIQPTLPAGVPSLKVTRVAYRDLIFDLEATPDRIHFNVESGGVTTPLNIRLPAGTWSVHIERLGKPQETFAATDSFFLAEGPLTSLTLQSEATPEKLP